MRPGFHFNKIFIADRASQVEQEFVADLKILKSHCNIIALVNFGAARSLAALIDN